jgi:hypothetical protein
VSGNELQLPLGCFAREVLNLCVLPSVTLLVSSIVRISVTVHVTHLHAAWMSALKPAIAPYPTLIQCKLTPLSPFYPSSCRGMQRISCRKKRTRLNVGAKLMFVESWLTLLIKMKLRLKQVFYALPLQGISGKDINRTQISINKTFWEESKSKLLYDWQSVCLGIEYLCGTCDQILFPAWMLLSEICGLISVGRPLWGEDGSAICSVITQWSESLRTRNHILLSHPRLPQQRIILLFYFYTTRTAYKTTWATLSLLPRVCLLPK